MDDIIKELGLPSDVLHADKRALDDEFERHPQHIAEVADNLALVRLARDKKKITLIRVEVRVRAEKRAENEGRKLTVKDLDDLVVADPEVRKAETEVAQHDYLVERVAGLLAALQAKTSALKHLSELYQAGYYTTSSGRARTSTRGKVDE